MEEVRGKLRKRHKWSTIPFFIPRHLHTMGGVCGEKANTHKVLVGKRERITLKT